MWENSCNCSGAPMLVDAAELGTSAGDALDAVKVLLVARATTKWRGCEGCRRVFESLLTRAEDTLGRLTSDAIKTWTELD